MEGGRWSKPGLMVANLQLLLQGAFHGQAPSTLSQCRCLELGLRCPKPTDRVQTAHMRSAHFRVTRDWEKGTGLKWLLRGVALGGYHTLK